MLGFSFKRITSSGRFIPEIDGLRFIALAAVVFYHLSQFLSVKMGSGYTEAAGYSVLRPVFARGHLGVPLFFVISGFILGMPFAKCYFNKGEPVSLKNYFMRRLTRLEPPYILVMTILFFATVFVVKKLSFTAGLESYFSSVFYVHNLVYGKQVLPLLNVVAWSLEIEVQFYVLAPLLACLFRIRSALTRRALLIGIIVFFLGLNNLMLDLPFLSLINYIQFFLVGFLLTDLYLSNTTLLPKTRGDNLIALICFVAIWVFDSNDYALSGQKFGYELMQAASIFLFYYYVIVHKTFKILSMRLITNIGGMCYSIYLIHYQIISLFGNVILRRSFSGYAFINISIYIVVLLVLIMVVSSMFFLLVERPCMDRTWYKKIFKTRKIIQEGLA